METGYRVGQRARVTTGQRVTLNRIGDAIVRRVHPFGTVDVESVATGRWYRVSGLDVTAPYGWGSAVLSAGAL